MRLLVGELGRLRGFLFLELREAKMPRKLGSVPGLPNTIPPNSGYLRKKTPFCNNKRTLTLTFHNVHFLFVCVVPQPTLPFTGQAIALRRAARRIGLCALDPLIFQGRIKVVVSKRRTVRQAQSLHQIVTTQRFRSDSPNYCCYLVGYLIAYLIGRYSLVYGIAYAVSIDSINGVALAC